MDYGNSVDGANVTLVDIARSRQQSAPNRNIFTYLDQNLAESEAISYRALDESARRIAVRLQRSGAPGDRVLLVFSNGAEFIKAVFGCFYAGRVAVPVCPPHSRKSAHWQAFENILRDADPVLVLTDKTWFEEVFAWSKQLDIPHTFDVTAFDDIADDANAWAMPPSDPSAIAVLQYTSGSTGVPKGVVVTHENLCVNAELFQRKCFQLDEHAATVTWMPHYHNMGLIGAMLSKFYVGARTVVMAPDAVLTKPVRWLHAMSRYRAVMTSAPNFAYDLCTKVVTDAEMASLDLSAWRFANLGGEPIRVEVLRAFARKFAACGFREEAFCPCYGLAEATLIVTTVGRKPWVARTLEQAALKEHRVSAIDATVAASRHGRSLQIVGAGPIATGQPVAIVNPTTLTRCGEDEIGEVWVTGPGVAAGYWGKPAATQDTFGARIAGESGGPYMRTGDLGFIGAGELYITGRLKDLIIVRGRNHYPQDIEATVQGSDPACQRSAGVAFAIDHGNEERLVIVQEIASGVDDGRFKPILNRARQAIVEQHEIQPHEIVLIRPASLPKTPSGKVQRRLTKEFYLSGQLDVVARWTIDSNDGSAGAVSALQSEIEKQVAEVWAEVLNVPVETLRADTNFLQMGGDSLKAKMMLGRVGERYSVELPLAELFELPTLAHTARLIELCQTDAGIPTDAEAIELENGTV